MKRPIVFLFVLVLLAGIAAFSPGSQLAETIRVTGGLVSGTMSQSGDIQIFKGIPFAAPPVGDLRWKAPQPVKPWSGVRRCDAFGPSPMQGTHRPRLACGAPNSSFRRSQSVKIASTSTSGRERLQRRGRSPASRRPVLVWIYGGGFNSGGSGVPIYDGEATARKGVVFVSINYRVGPFGFMAHPELSRESGKNASGNYGLMDQIAALQWVKQNIAAFGGDPANVTIAGQSAGSMAVNCLVASPLAKGPVQQSHCGKWCLLCPAQYAPGAGRRERPENNAGAGGVVAGRTAR